MKNNVTNLPSVGLLFSQAALRNPDWLLLAKKENNQSQRAALLQLKFNSLKLFILQSLNIRSSIHNYIMLILIIISKGFSTECLLHFLS